ncbi:hypothetical protein [Paenibacillus sp. NPDC058071]|uniref:hypothetical protein n=1 Tax=Paenibacillus sp. NPDC058071 TaxID=3346326 RepID=UPI0036DF944F
MSISFKRAGTGVWKDHNELANKGRYTHERIDHAIEEIDEARGNYVSLDGRMTEYAQSIGDITNEIANARGSFGTLQERIDAGTISTEFKKKLSDLEQEIVQARDMYPTLDARLDAIPKEGGGLPGGSSGGSSIDLNTVLHSLKSRTDLAAIESLPAYIERNTFVEAFNDTKFWELSNFAAIRNGTLMRTAELSLSGGTPVNALKYGLQFPSATIDQLGGAVLTATASSIYSGYSFPSLFDGNPLSTSYWLQAGETKPTIKMHFSRAIAVDQFFVVPFARSDSYASSLTWYASTDGISYVKASETLTNTNAINPAGKRVAMTNLLGDTPYSYYRLDMTNSGTWGACLNEISLSLKLTNEKTVSQAVTKTIPLSRTPLAMLISSGPTGGATYDISFDDGATWLKNVETDRVLDTSGQAGLQLRFRINLVSGAQVDDFAVQWYDDNSLIPFPVSNTSSLEQRIALLEKEIGEAREPFDSLDARLDNGTGSGSDLDHRVKELESSLSTVAVPFAEDFKTSNRVDVANTTAVVGTGYVRVNRDDTFTESFSSTDHLQLNDSLFIEVDTVKGAASLSNDQTDGVLMSREFEVPENADFIRVEASATHLSTMNFSSYKRVSVESVPQYYPAIVTDRAQRTWEIWFEQGIGIRARATDKSGQVVVDKLAVSASAMGTHTFPTNSPAASIQAVVDIDNKIWAVVPAHRSNGYGAIFKLVILPDGTGQLSLLNNASYNFRSCDIEMDNDGRIWFVWSYQSYYYYYCAFSSDEAVYMDIKSVSTNMYVMSLSLINDSKRGVLRALYTVNNGTGSNGGLYAITLTSTGASAAVRTFASTNMVSSPTWSHYDPALDCINVFGLNSNTRELFRITFRQANGETRFTGYSEAVGTMSVNVRGAYRNGAYYLVYGSMKKSAVIPSINYSVIDAANDSLIIKDAAVNADVSGKMRAYIGTGGDGNLIVVYETQKFGTNFSIERADYQMASSQLTALVSNDGGASWLTAPLGDAIDFPSPGRRIKLKWRFSAQVPYFGPTLHSYSFSTGNADGFGATEQVFQSAKLPSASTISAAILHAEQDLSGGGKIEWFLSNDGGVSWVSVNLGEKISFLNKTGNDFRLRAVMSYPVDGTKPPMIKSYSVVSYNTLMAKDVSDLQIALMQTNFRLAAITKATRYGMKNVWIDDLNDASGFSNLIGMDILNGRLLSNSSPSQTCTVVTKAEQTDIPPTTALLTLETKDSFAYFISRDDGGTWKPIVPDVLVRLDDLPEGNQIRLKIETDKQGLVIQALGLTWY